MSSQGPDGLAFQRALSRWNARLLDAALAEGRYRTQGELDLSLGGYLVHPWPMFVDTDRIAAWAGRSLAMRRLMLKAALSLAPTGAPELAALFGYSPERAALIARLLTHPDRFDAAASRADFLLAEGELRCCEVDFGEVGIWQLTSVDALVHHSTITTDLGSQGDLRIRQRNPLRTVVRQMLRMAGEAGRGGECNLAVLVPDDTPTEAYEDGQLQVAFASSLYQGELRALGRDGELVFGRVGAVEDRGDHATIDGRRIQLLLTEATSFAAEARAWMGSALPDVVERGVVAAVNGPHVSHLGNKLVLALLSEAAARGALDAAEAALVASTLPWTRRVRAVQAEHRGRTRAMADLLLSAKDDFVLKPGEGYSGEGVRIGRNTSAADWAQAVARALELGNWVAQEAVGGTSLLLAGAEDVAYHSVNIGVVVSDEDYVGTFLRLMPLASPDDIPTIDYSRGALSGGVIEVEG